VKATAEQKIHAAIELMMTVLRAMAPEDAVTALLNVVARVAHALQVPKDILLREMSRMVDEAEKCCAGDHSHDEAPRKEIVQ